MKPYIKYIIHIMLFFAFFGCTEVEQPKSNTDSSFAISNDISNQYIGSFAEDAMGHIWIGTIRGANKHNVHEFHQYFSSNDSLSISGSQIRQIFRDSQNRLWFCTTGGLCIYTDKNCFRRIKIDAQTQNAMQILEDKQGRIFINQVGQLCEYDEHNNIFKVVIPDFENDDKWNNRCFIDQKGDLLSISGAYIQRFDTETKEMISRTHFGSSIHYAFLHNDLLWIASGVTLSIFDVKNEKIVELPDVIRCHNVLSQTITTYIHPYSDTELLISTHKGIFLYNYLSQTLIHQSEDGFPFVAPDFNITTMFTDSQKNLWIGSYDQGFVVKYSYQAQFNSNSYLVSQFENKSVTSISVDCDENLWITTSFDGIFLYDAQKKNIRPIDITTFFPDDNNFENFIRSIFIDSENNIWLIPEKGRLIKCRFDGYRLQRIDDYFLQTSITVMAEDNDGTLYAMGFNHNIYILRNGDTNFRKEPLYPPGSYVFTSAMKLLSDGQLFISSFANNMLIINLENWKIEAVDILGLIKKSIVVPTVVFEDSQSDIWIGTLVNGLFRYNRKTNHLEEIIGTACTDIAAIQEDTYGNIWISTLFGLSKYDRQRGQIINYYKSDGICGNQFNERSVCRMADGTLIFGGTHGLTSFKPDDIDYQRNFPLVFGELKIHHQLVFPYKSRVIDRHLSYRPTIRLKQAQNSFSISFVALDYSEFERVNYYYMLEGYDKIWIDAGNNHEAYYSNLSAGKYVFRVKTTDKENKQTEAENAIDLRISPAPAASSWAICIYLILFGLVVYFIYRIGQKVKKEREKALQIQREKEQEEMVNKMNMSYFANVSHEFRTPLTMISSPVKTLCDDKTITGENKKLLYIVQRSIHRMLKLVNQLMDFNLLENDALKLKVRYTDIIPELNQFVDIFKFNASNKNISLITNGLEDSFPMWIDVDKLDNIMSNLLSNALKFTPSGGKIVVSFDVVDDMVKITVQDTGRGIPEDKLEKIFERYYQIDQTQGIYNWGTGIGLYYARRLAELHHGFIKAENTTKGGSIFTLLLPLNENVYLQKEKDVENDGQDFIFPIQTEEQYHDESTENTENNKSKILVVDDDSDIVNYLKTLLSRYYRVIVGYDAAIALKMIEEEAPDLILSDVMMPDVNGYEFCRSIKNDINFCHIPVVLVTAKTTVENQVEGLDSGADAYVTKPFDPDVLLALIKSQLKNRENLRRLLGRETKTDKIVEENILSPQDNAFMTELYRLMETELSNSELNITRMTQVLKISRTKLYYKIKGLTGNNPNVFFKTYKLNRAAEILREGKLNISEVADITGFSTLPHFSRSFKKQFGVPPSEFLE
jgi:signal transduction histidine kinase/DNA-binding response OmpR family regulator/ligand-binding sensor domain-containing protein